MKTKSEKTRNRLLTAASRIFAEKGFQESTIAGICEQAETNIASVNYHFRDKETLYLESWRFAFNRELGLYPPNGGVRTDAPAEQRLAGRIRSLINRVADDNSYSFAIINKEMAQPTRLLSDILEKGNQSAAFANVRLVEGMPWASSKRSANSILPCQHYGSMFSIIAIKTYAKRSPFSQSSK